MRRRHQAYRWLQGVLPGVVGAYIFLRRPEDWERFYLPAARLFSHGTNFYPLTFFAYPPAAVLLPWLAIHLPVALQSAVWILASVAAMMALLRVGWRAAGGGWPETDEHVAIAAGFALSFRFIVSALEHRQSDVIVAALATGGAWCAMRGRAVSGGALAGAAAALKATPAALVAVFAFRREWRAALAMALVATALTILPDAVHPSSGGRLWVAEWSRMTKWYSENGRPGELFLWPVDPWYNHSIAGTLQRVACCHVDSTRLEQPRLSRAALGLVTVVLTALVGGLALVALAARARDDTARVPRAAVQFAAVFAAMPLVSPVSGTYHFLILTQPAWTVARLATVERRRDARFAFVAALVLGTLSMSQFGRIADVVEYLGAIPLAAALLLVACARANVTISAPGESKRKEQFQY